MKQIVYDEVYAVLCALGDNYVAKVPMEFLDYIATNKSDAEIIIKKDVPLEEQGLDRDTILVLAVLKLDFWSEMDDGKEVLLRLLEKNQMEVEEELKGATSTMQLLKILKKGSIYEQAQ